MMSGIRSRNTVPEIRVRRLLHRQGYRFRLHRGDLPGTPDIVLPSRRIAIFVHGCFWHLHQGCRLARVPGTREDFWRAKLTRNRERDEAAIAKLRALGWRVLVVWECYLRGSKDDAELAGALSMWVEACDSYGELSEASSAGDC
ncbi:DNA mismatch endonuclease vsr [Hydrogenophaga taeniospiralis CCUG 15921]|uniref:Very short patch repair endonuclease n=2 Tax=Hydrogenophaga TaxID=47420 RepID=A0A9X4NQP8_9BURK|nr:DNA mismatch endonuclease vsr [Hydrogenophaga taeniospiralis CCUG 15921]